MVLYLVAESQIIIASKSEQVNQFDETNPFPKITPYWPLAFNMTFNPTIIMYGYFGSPSVLYYDFHQLAERIAFAFCCDGSNVPCSYIFNASLGFLIKGEDCCIAAPVGTVAPTWVKNLNFNGTSLVYGQVATSWTGGQPLHDLFFSSTTNEPVMLLVEDIFELWAFTSPFQLGAQNPKLFDIPSDCQSQCPQQRIRPLVL